jgi:hypothetical protein
LSAARRRRALVDHQVAQDALEVALVGREPVVAHPGALAERADEDLLHEVLLLERLAEAVEAVDLGARAEGEPEAGQLADVGRVGPVDLAEDLAVAGAEALQGGSIVQHSLWGTRGAYFW